MQMGICRCRLAQAGWRRQLASPGQVLLRCVNKKKLIMYADLPKASSVASCCFPQECHKGHRICEDYSDCTKNFSCSNKEDCKLGAAKDKSLSDTSPEAAKDSNI